MNANFVINARGRFCLLHDAPFEAIPLWLRYDQTKSALQIIFDNGTFSPLTIDNISAIKDHLLTEKKVFVIRLEGKIPVEGFDINILVE